MNYGKAIRVVRSAHGLSQADLARRLSLSASHLSLLESGNRQPSSKVLGTISSVMSVPASLLTALAFEPEDLMRAENQEQINDLGKALLQLLVLAKEEDSPASGQTA